MIFIKELDRIMWPGRKFPGLFLLEVLVLDKGKKEPLLIEHKLDQQGEWT